MVYKWEKHREILRRLYVDEKKTLDEIVEIMRRDYQFMPSRRAYQGAFSRWKFPTKQNPAYKDERLIERIKELWEKNYNQRDMLRILNEEDGYDIGEREVQRIRTRHNLLLREIGGYGQPKHTLAWKKRKLAAERAARRAAGEVVEEPDDDDDDDDDDDNDGDDNDDDDDDESEDGDDDEDEEEEAEEEEIPPPEPIPEPQDPEQFVAHRQAEREERRRQIQREAQEKWATKKRRRHTKPYGVLPADPPCPPRFPSETTLAEAKEILQLDAPAYATIRDKFMNICNNAGVTKKTLCGPERWEQLKDQLVRESMHLRAAMWDPDNGEQKKLAIEIIANDVTKRIRTMNRKMTVVEAKSILGLNPIQGRDIRAEMYNILVEERFTAKLEEGLEKCRELRKRWIARSDILTRIVESEGTDPDWERKMRAINVLARDAERRYQDDVFRKGKIPGGPRTPTPEPKPKPPPKPRPAKKAKPSKQTTAPERDPTQVQAQTQAQAQVQSLTPVPMPLAAAATARAVSQVSQVSEEVTPVHDPTIPGPDGLIPGLALPPSMKKRRGRPPKKKPAETTPAHSTARFLPEANDEDQMLMDAQLGTEMLLTSETQNPFVNDQYVQGYAAAQHQPTQPSHQVTPIAPQAVPQQAGRANKSSLLAVYYRLHSATRVLFPDVPVQWIHPLAGRTFKDVKEAATRKTPGAICFQIEGIIKDGEGGELPLPVTDDMELQAYLDHVQGHGAPTFNVHLVPGGGFPSV
ncbi:hypothetical protein QBC42DRAFT_225849 [Cladorrhinum samala]|uniref:Clr5 domain-containing protein n=1 Tax=Cladorrhinum samala TaxID=585594 RepID=A0AAV9HPU0_9PEZI|nr:hypothetical protein QBC42DRAFT_225849 [Cladorrhinum samala]